MQSASRRSRGGFTLIELLMVIMIIGLLATLGTRAAFKALQKAKQAAILMEISQLDQALGDYKTIANGFPPCMGDVAVASRQSRFYTHVTRAFPRYYVADFKADGARNYLDMQAQIIQNFGGKAGSWYDLDTMDQAEALVFWLSGFPTPRVGNTPTGALLGSSKILGFCASPTAPFFDTPGKPLGVFTTTAGTVLNTVDRKPLGFQFDEGRLVDQDNDGWLEYVPMGTSATTLIPPYVYFDGDLYTGQTTGNTAWPYKSYPSTVTPVAGPATNTAATSWGIATPYAAALPTSATVQMLWINPRKFQIICSGLDNSYGVMGTTVSPFNTNLPKIFPAGNRYDPSGADTDNLTNFSDGRQLGDAQ
jgi:prepilin-type N-terminal cleavage/methylation domain-containing protein